MKKSEIKSCKTEGCTNEVLDGKYCEYCKQERKEKGITIAGIVVGIGTGIGIAIKSGIVKKGVTGAIKIYRTFKG